MNRHITNRMILCDWCSRPIDPMIDYWETTEDGCSICCECVDDLAAEKKSADELADLILDVELYGDQDTDLAIRRFDDG